MKIKLAKKIVINGKEYASPDEMPPEIRPLYDKAMEAFADRDGNQVPDFLEGKGPGFWQSAKQICGVAREAQRLGINQVSFGSATKAADDMTTAASQRPSAALKLDVALKFSTPTTSSPIEPEVTGGGGMWSFVFLLLLVGGALFFAHQLGWF